jgi:hypothetical protein
VQAVYARLRDSHAHLGPDGSHELARHRLTAASSTTAATSLLSHLEEPAPVAPEDVDAASQELFVAMISRWICHPDHYIDPAVTLAKIMPPDLRRISTTTGHRFADHEQE